MSLADSPTSLAAMKPIHDSRDASTHIFQVPEQSGVSGSSHPSASSASSFNASKPVFVKASPVLTPRTPTIDTSNSMADTAPSDTAHSNDSTPLHPIIADRVLLMTLEEALNAEQALEEHGDEWYERSGLFDRHNSSDNPLPGRDRAFSAPGSGEGLPSLCQASDNVGGSKVHCAGRCGMDAHKPTVKEWVADIDCVSGVIGAMLADDDRGAR